MRPRVAERTFSMRAAPPFRLDLTAWALRRRASNGIDAWDGAAYRRTLELQHTVAELTAVQAGPAEEPRLAVTLRGRAVDEDAEAEARAALRRLLGLGVELAGFYRLAARDPLLGPLAARFAGVKPPRFATPFECLVNAIACQQLTLTAGIALLDRLAAAHGAAAACGGRRRAFPAPARLAPLAPQDLRALGFSTAKARSIVQLARGVAGAAIDLEALHALADARWLSLPAPLDHAGVQAAVARFQPYAGLVYFHLLLDSINPPATTEAAAA
jgi:DNA-3-methyladenine glycosylase II